MSSFDVAIVGLGPTGATLAALLGDMGCRVLILDREDDIYDLPRAVHFDDEVMRVLQWVGIADSFEKQVIVNKGMRFVDTAGNLLLDWPRPQEVTTNGWHASYRFHQPELERALRSSLKQRQNVEVLCGHVVEHIEDQGDKVFLRYRNRSTGETHEASVMFVVGCDGANSMVRQTLGAEMEPLGFEQRWLVVDVVLSREIPELGDFTLQYCDAQIPATYCRNVGLRRRWEFALTEDESDDFASAPENIWKRLERWLTPKDATLERSAIYTFKSEVAETWVKGRLMIAGDAAHLTPPFMGQGLCAGIRDASNLAWKLAQCCRTNDPSFLATYQSERKPVAQEYISTAVHLGELINQMGASGATTETREMKSPETRLGKGLGDRNDTHSGYLFSQVTLSSGHRLDDLIGHDWALITSVSLGMHSVQNVRILETKNETSLEDVLNTLSVKAALIRPDKRIFATANSKKNAVELVKSIGAATPHQNY